MWINRDGASGAGASTRSTATVTSPSIVAEATKLTRFIVPLDGSPFSEKALPTARWAAQAHDADIQLLQIVSDDEDADDAIRYLDTTGRRHGAAAWNILEHRDVAEALAEATAGTPGSMICLATHGRDRSAALLGSVAASFLHHSAQPALLTGPQAQPIESPTAPVAVAVDGSPRDDALVAVGLGWAIRTQRPLLIVTVAEPVPQFHDEQTVHRSHGPTNPEDYVATLAVRAETPEVAIDTQTIYHPISVRDGLVPALDRSPALVVLGTRPRHRIPQMVLGNHAARIVHDSAIPALVVPTPTDGDSDSP
jgi:nucleotide-binding universal stress UspA family protein